MNLNINSERLFFIYAFPCAGVLLNMGSISKEKYDNLKKMFMENKTPTREELEDIFKAAFRRIKRLAERMNKDYWDIDVIKEYWENEHNKIIDANDGHYKNFPESFKDFCKVHKAKVLEKKEIDNNKILVVEYNNKKRNVFYPLIPDIKIGDIVTIHHAHAIEKIS